MAQRRVGAHAKLLANYASDDAIIAAGEAAELLFVRALAFCASSDSDGYITDAQLTRFVGAGMRDAKRRAETLVREGLWSREDGGYQVRSWLSINPSSAEKGYRRKTDRERKRAQRPDGIHENSERNPSGIHEDSDTEGARSPCNELLRKSVTEPEQINTDHSSAPPKTESAQKRGTRLPADWRPDDDLTRWTLEHLDRDTAATELTKFRNHWIAKTGKDATKLDWGRTWQNWVLNTRTPYGRPRAGDGIERTLQRMETLG